MSDEQVFKFKEILDNFGEKPKVEAPGINPPPGHVPCGCGKKFMPMEELKQVITPHCEAVDNICNECHKDCATHSRVVCVTCRTVVSRIAPHKDKSGFVFEKGASYHVPFCPNCQPDCVSSPMAEKVIWDQEQKRR